MRTPDKGFQKLRVPFKWYIYGMYIGLYRDVIGTYIITMYIYIYVKFRASKT